MLKISQEELNEVIKNPRGEEFNRTGSEKGVFTIRDLLVGAANHAEEGDSIADSMRLYRLQEKLAGTNGMVELDDSNLDELRKRGHERWKGNPWLCGKLHLTLKGTEDAV